MNDFISSEPGYEEIQRFKRELESLNQLAFAHTDQEAQRRFLETRRSDPFPSIPPALLNTSDVCRYIARTGMITPFRLSEKDLKLATYNFRLLGRVVYWDKKGEKVSRDVNLGDEFKLEGNSIAFVTLEPKLRIPDYIALRFNLRVDNVYRGLLLGTGPIIDPGYVGRLSIPLHNLTTNSYTFRGGDRLISVEFTKLSPHRKWHRYQRPTDIEYEWESPWEGTAGRDSKDLNEESVNRLCNLYFPAKPGSEIADPDERNVEYHIREAEPHRPVESSIPKITEEAQRSAEDARTETERMRRRAQYFGAATLIAIVSLVLAVSAFYLDFRADRDAYLSGGLATDELLRLQAEVDSELLRLQAEVDSMRAAMRVACDSLAAQADGAIPECNPFIRP